MKNKRLPKGVPTPILRIFESTPVLGNEDVNAYWGLLAYATEDFQPRDIYEWILVKESIDDTWEAVRWRRLKVPILELELRRAMDAALRRILPQTEGKKIAEISEHYTSDPVQRASAEKLLKLHGQSLDCVHAQAFKQCGDHLDRMDMLMEKASRRRDRGIQTLERRRADIILRNDDVAVIEAAPVKKIAD